MSDQQNQINCHPKDFPGMDVYAVVGNPIAHSRSPEIHAMFAHQTHQMIHYGKIFAPLDAFAKTVRDFFEAGGLGLNVTVPFKIEAYQLADVLSERAQAAGAVNILMVKNGRLFGDNSDGVGLVRDLKNAGCEIHGKKILLLGAGGAAQGAVLPLLEEQPVCLTFSNRTLLKANQMMSRFAQEADKRKVDLNVEPLEKIETRGPFDLVINATASGLNAASPLKDDQIASLIHAKTFAYDMLYGKPTPFLEQFKNVGIKTLDGLGMLVEQAAEAFELWRGDAVKGKLDTRSVLERLKRPQ